VHDLAGRVHEACAERLAAFCGPEQVGALPEVPSITETSDLPEPPPADDPAAFEAWRETLMALSYERGKGGRQTRGHSRASGRERGERSGFDRGHLEVSTAVERQTASEALRAILAARGIPVDADSQAKIEATRDPEALRGLLARA
jgi:hypothetical protein